MSEKKNEELELCRQCGKTVQRLTHIMVLGGDGLSGRPVECCKSCKSFYERQNARIRKRLQSEYRGSR